jgi:hypothetical protein
MSTGSVHVYLLDAQGQPVGSQHVAMASKVEELTSLLERTIERLKVPAGKTIVPPAPQSVARKGDADALVLHLVARNVTRAGGADVPTKAVLGLTKSANWGAYPAEDWIVLGKTEWARLVPKGPFAPGMSWEPDKETAAKVLKHFYPSSENNNVAKNRIDRQEVKATVTAIKDGVVRARLDGSLRMKHTFYHKDDANFVDAKLLGFLDFEAATGRVVNLQLITNDATYGRMRFGVAMRTVASRE